MADIAGEFGYGEDAILGVAIICDGGVLAENDGGGGGVRGCGGDGAPAPAYPAA